MIIELFGPPGAGKTTCADRLASELRRSGMRVELVLSHRPAEVGGRLGDRAAFLRRLMRAAGHLFYILVSSRLGASRQLVRQLLSLLPQTSVLRASRLAQYLFRLDHSWRRARASSHVVIFDQAYLQAVYTLAARLPDGAIGRVAEAVDLLPQPDLTIYVEVGLPALQDRLRTRSVRQSHLERLLDSDARVFANDFTILTAICARMAALSRDFIPLKGEGEVDLTPVQLAVAEHMAAGEPTRPLPGSAPARVAPRAFVSASCLAALVGSLTLLGPGLHPASGLETATQPSGLPAAAALAPARGLAPDAPGRVMHFTSGGNFDRAGHYTPARSGFDLADVSTVGQLDRLPSGVQALVWIGLCTGATQEFADRVAPFLGRPEVFAFYLMDDPDPRGLWGPHCPPSSIAAEVDWIKARMPGARTFLALMNMGSFAAPSYRDGYTSANSHADLFGIAVYPCTSSDAACDLDAVDRFVSAAVAGGIAREQIVPVFQAFGGGTWRTDRGGAYVLPKATEVEALIQRWRAAIPAPAFDYAYSWGSQRGDSALATAPDLAAVFERHNRGLAAPRPGESRGASGDAINPLGTSAPGDGR